jgi:hypothetical protein
VDQLDSRWIRWTAGRDPKERVVDAQVWAWPGGLTCRGLACPDDLRRTMPCGIICPHALTLLHAPAANPPFPPTPPLLPRMLRSLQSTRSTQAGRQAGRQAACTGALRVFIVYVRITSHCLRAGRPNHFCNQSAPAKIIIFLGQHFQ